MKKIAWSHSSLNAFETCPKRYYHTRVAKDVPDPPGSEASWGNAVHKALELKLKGEAPLPSYLSNLENLTNMLTRQHGFKLVEGKMALDEAFNPCSWRGDAAWVRGIIDVGLVSEGKAFVGDWKTGKRKPDSDQMKLMSLMTFAHHPSVKEVHTAFIWLKEKKLDKDVFTREQVGELWGDFLPRVKRLEIAYEQQKWQPKPSGLCGKWCPVTKKHCPYGR